HSTAAAASSTWWWRSRPNARRGQQRVHPDRRSGVQDHRAKALAPIPSPCIHARMTRHLLFALFLLPAAPMALADPALTGTAPYGGWRREGPGAGGPSNPGARPAP